MRLEQEPPTRVRKLEELMSLAAAMEREAMQRYAQLAARMTKRGEHGLAAAFQAMVEEERDHLDAVERWSLEVTGAPPREMTERWRLPPEIARSWDEVVDSALLTPYRALSIAVLNEERGFAFYSYIAAHAEDRAVRQAAERLAGEELNHAAVLRRERRRAFRREHQGKTAPRGGSPIAAPDFAAAASRTAIAVAERLEAIAAWLAELGEAADAAAVLEVAGEERKTGAVPAPTSPRTAPLGNRTELLRGALAEVERLYDFHADALDRPGTEAVLHAAQQGAMRAIRHLGRIASRLHAPRPATNPDFSNY